MQQWAGAVQPYTVLLYILLLQVLLNNIFAFLLIIIMPCYIITTVFVYEVGMLSIKGLIYCTLYVTTTTTFLTKDQKH